MTKRLELVAEVYGTTTSGWRDSDLDARLGATWKLNEHATILLSAGKFLHGPECNHSFLAYTGVSITF